jgi:hypothetical protein
MHTNGHVTRLSLPGPAIAPALAADQPVIVELRLGEDLAAALAALARLLPAIAPAQAPASPTRPGAPHAPDWSSVVWNDVRYMLTPKQRLVVAELWRAWEAGIDFLSGAYLLERAESDQSKLWYLFRKSPAWGTLIVPGEPYGGPGDTYRLAPPLVSPPAPASTEGK